MVKRSASQASSSASESPKKKIPRKDTTSPSHAWYNVFTKGDEEYNQYMATEWGFEKRGDTALFEKLSLEGAQSGLSWLTILRKREAYRRAFHDFDVDQVAKMTDTDVNGLVNSASDAPRDTIVRHRGKIQAVINNAQRILEMREEAPKGIDKGMVLDQFLWGFVDDKPILNRWNGKNLTEALAKTDVSEAMSKALKKKGFKFVGPTTCYAMMQSVGMVNDHPVNSPEWKGARDRLKQRPGGYQEGGK